METLLIGMIVLITLLVIGMPVPFAFFGATCVLMIREGYDPLFLIPFAYNNVNTLVLLAIPLYILAGKLMQFGGIGNALVNFAGLFVGKIRGSMGVVMSFSCGLFGSISGSGLATMSAIGSILLPRMYELGYPKGHCSALIGSAGVIGLLIPPSVNMILLAFIAQAPMISCFFSTLIPGILLMFTLGVANCLMLRKNETIRSVYEMPTSRKEKVAIYKKASFQALPALFCPILILGGIYTGLFTPTEAAAVAVIYAIPVGIIFYRGLNLKKILEAFVDAATTTGIIFILLFTVIMLSRIFIMENIPQVFMNFLTTISDNPIINLMMINVSIAIVGMFMDDGSAIILLTPMLMPMLRQLGLSAVHSAALLSTNIGMGTVIPPCAPFLFFAARVGNADFGEMLVPTFKFLLFAWLPVIIATTYIPAVSEWMPQLLGLSLN